MIGLVVTTGVVVAVVSLGVMTFFADKVHTYIYFFHAMCVSIIIWTLANFLLNNPAALALDSHELTRINEVAFAAGYGILLSALLFTYYFPTRKRVASSEVIGVILLASLTLVSSFFESVVGGVDLTIDGAQYDVGEWVWIYIIGFTITLALIYRNLTRASGEAETARQKNQKKFILLGFAASAGAGLILNLVIPVVTGEWQTTEIGPLVVLAMVSIVAYTIVKHGLFDVKMTVVRGSGYGLTLLVLALLYYLVAYTISHVIFGNNMRELDTVQAVNMALALLLAFLFQPVRHFFDKITDRLFYRDTYDTDDFYTRINNALSMHLSLRGLLRKIAGILVENMKANSAFFFVATEDNQYVVAGSARYPKVSPPDLRAIQQYYQRGGHRMSVYQLLDAQHPLIHIMNLHNISVIVPLRRSSGLVGFLALGNRHNGQYDSRDLRVLTTIAGEIVVAIENALSVLEVRELNTTLQQRVREATKELRESNNQLRHLDEVKDEFLSIASHQLRTPLTSVKGYISLVLDGDAGKINDQQRHLLEEAFTSSQRMVHLIEDFLNMSRLQTGRFVIDRHESDVVQMISDEVSHLANTAKARNLTLSFKKKGALPTSMNVDESKLRQVVMNFIDNAMYYSDPGDDISISVERQDEYLVFRVVDSGIGVPEEAQKHLFGKFYRAGNARNRRPDGTGVGLYLAKKVVTEHGGEIIFSSVENQGSTFGFKLPVREALSEDSAK